MKPSDRSPAARFFREWLACQGAERAEAAFARAAARNPLVSASAIGRVIELRRSRYGDPAPSLPTWPAAVGLRGCWRGGGS